LSEGEGKKKGRTWRKGVLPASAGGEKKGVTRVSGVPKGATISLSWKELVIQRLRKEEVHMGLSPAKQSKVSSSASQGGEEKKEEIYVHSRKENVQRCRFLAPDAQKKEAVLFLQHRGGKREKKEKPETIDLSPEEGNVNERRASEKRSLRSC